MVALGYTKTNVLYPSDGASIPGHPLRPLFASVSVLCFPDDIEAVVTVRAAIGQGSAVFDFAIFGKKAEEMGGASTLDARVLGGGISHGI